VAPHPAPDPSPATLQDASAAVRPSVTLTHLAKEAHEAEIHAIVIYATERFVSASADATIRVWDARTLAPLYTLRAQGRLEPIAHDGAVYALLLVPSPPSPPSPAGSAAGLRLLSGGGDRLIRVWDLASLEQQATLAGHRSFVCALAADAHRQRLFSASSDKTCIVWHLGTYERLRVLAGHRGGLYSLVVHEGRPCSGSLDETIRVWTLRD
jgi:WD40 repeat protein